MFTGSSNRAMLLATLLAAGLSCPALAVTTATFDGGAGASPDTFPGSAGDGWSGAFVHNGAAPTVTNANPLDGGTNYLSYTAQGVGGTNIAREYNATSTAHTISWLFRFDPADLSQFNTFGDRLHFFGNDGFVGSGGTSASNSWAIIAAGGQQSGAPLTVGEFSFYDSDGDSNFEASNMVGTGIALTPGDVYDVKVTVDPNRKQYSAVLTNTDTGQTFSRSGMNFRNSGGTGAQFTDIHFGKTSNSATDAFPLSIDSIKIDVAKEIVAKFTDGQNTQFADAYVGKAGAGWAGPWSAVETAPVVTTSNPLDGVAGNPYLSVGVDGTPATGNRTVRRQWESFGEVDPNATHKITWQWRFDGDISDFGGSFDDRIHFFADTSAQAGTGATNTWAIGVVAADRTGNDIHEGQWYFFDNNGSNAFNVGNMFNTGLSLLDDTVYTFEVIVDPTTGTYYASIFDGTNLVEASDLGFRRGTPAVGTFLHFGGNVNNAGDDFTFALDNIRITAVIIPEPATMSLLGLAGLALVRRRRAV